MAAVLAAAMHQELQHLQMLVFLCNLMAEINVWNCLYQNAKSSIYIGTCICEYRWYMYIEYPI